MDHGSFAFTRIDDMSCTLTVDGPCRRTLSFSIDRATVDARVGRAARLATAEGRVLPGRCRSTSCRTRQGRGRGSRRAPCRAFQDAVSEHKLHRW
jgi:hypothetical protein